MVIGGDRITALADTLRALSDFDDCPQTMRLLRGMQVYLLASTPDQRDAAYQLAAEMTIEARLSDRAIRVANQAGALLNAAAAVKPGVRDKRLVHLAMALLYDWPTSDLVGKSSQELHPYRLHRVQLQGWAYHLLGDSSRATASIEEAIRLVKELKQTDAQDAAQHTQLEELESTLREYSAAGQPQ